MPTMRAMLLDAAHSPLHLVKLPIPMPGAGQVLLKVSACGVCHTDQIAGRVVQSGPGS